MSAAKYPLGSLTVTRYATQSRRRRLASRHLLPSKLSQAANLPPSEPSLRR